MAQAPASPFAFNYLSYIDPKELSAGGQPSTETEWIRGSFSNPPPRSESEFTKFN